jgi:hypothetical protein
MSDDESIAFAPVSAPAQKIAGDPQHPPLSPVERFAELIDDPVLAGAWLHTALVGELGKRDAADLVRLFGSPLRAAQPDYRHAVGAPQQWLAGSRPRWPSRSPPTRPTQSRCVAQAPSRRPASPC